MCKRFVCYRKLCSLIVFLLSITYCLRRFVLMDLFADLNSDNESHNGTWRHFSRREIQSLSELGRIMFIEETITNNYPFIQKPSTDRTFVILIWKHGRLLENRHIRHYTYKSHDPFANCSVSNCILSYNESDLRLADAVFFHLHQFNGTSSLPPSSTRPSHQRWVFVTDESPYNTFMYRHRGNTMTAYNGIFNWSMSYKMNSDVPVPYGRTLRIISTEKNTSNYEKNYAQTKVKLAAIMGSNCGGENNRWRFVKILQRYMKIDIYGACGTLKCLGYFNLDCPLLVGYKFYLAFENSNCREYISEKVWWHSYHKDTVPVIMGATREDCSKFLPPNSYIHTEDFASPEALAKYLIYLDSEDEEYNKYFSWKKEFRVLNEHGYFQSDVFHYCRLCEALNYNSQAPKVYNNLEDFISVSKECYQPSWK